MSISCFFLIVCNEVTAVGKRIRRKWDLPWGLGGALAVLSGCFLLGGIVGCLFAALSDGQGAQELGAYLGDYLLLAEEGSVSGGLWPILWGRMKYLLAAVVLGATALGTVGLPILIGVQGFFLSFSVGCFCRVFGPSGLLPAFALFGLPALLWVPSLFLAGVQGLTNARNLLNRAIGTGGRGGCGFGGEQWRCVGLCVGLILCCAFLEYWVVPVLLEACARVVL